MTLAYIAGGLIGGLIVGYLIGMMGPKGKLAIALEELTDARDKLKSLKRDNEKALSDAREKHASAKGKADAAAKEAAELKKSLQAAKSTLDDLQKTHATAQEAAEAHKMARQQAEGKTKQAEGVLAQTQQQLKTVETQLQQVQTEHTSLKETNDRQTKELARLRSNAADARGSSSGLEESVEIFAGSDGTLEGVLNILMDNEGQRAAVVADNNGIIVAATGAKDLKEGMAAAAQLIHTSVKQLEGVVPFSDLRAYLLQDGDANVIAGRFFKCAGEDLGLATHGSHAPSDRILDGAAASVGSILE